jgi:MipA family protein
VFLSIQDPRQRYGRGGMAIAGVETLGGGGVAGWTGVAREDERLILGGCAVTMMKLAVSVGAALVFGGGVISNEAGAQSLPVAEMPSVAGLVPQGMRVTVGVIGTYEPKYEGGKTYEFLALPVFKLNTDSGLAKRFDVRNLDDISFAVVQKGDYQLGVLTGWRQDRNESDAPRLHGLGDVDGGLVAGGFARYNFGPAFVRASYHRQVWEQDTGGLLKTIVGFDYLLNSTITLHGFAGVEAGDHTYMKTYFGVSDAQAARSGLTAYKASGGAKSFHLGVGTDYEILPTWTLTASAEYVHYLGSAARSPILEEADQVKARLGLAKSFTMDLSGR